MSNGLCNNLLDTDWWQNTTIDKIEEALKAEDVNEQNEYGYTALMLACQKGYKDIVELLLQNKANVNFLNPKNSWTSLITASSKGYADIVKLLLKYGATSKER